MNAELPPLPHMPRDKAAIIEARERILQARLAEAEEQRGQWAGLCVRLEARIAELEADAERMEKELEKCQQSR